MYTERPESKKDSFKLFKVKYNLQENTQILGNQFDNFLTVGTLYNHCQKENEKILVAPERSLFSQFVSISCSFFEATTFLLPLT